MMKISTIYTRAGLLSAGLLFAGASAYADTWDGGGVDDEYSTADNWTLNVAPSGGFTADISGVFTVERLVDSTSGRTFVDDGAVLNVTGGTHNDNNNGNTQRNFFGNSGDCTVNQTGGTYSIGHMTAVGRNGAGVYNLSGGTLSIYRGGNTLAGNPNTFGGSAGGSLSVGWGTGSGLMSISGGVLETRIGVEVGDTGTFEVQGSGATSIGIGSQGTLDGHWWQQAGGVLKVGIDVGGVTKILIDDNATATTDPYVHFQAGAVLDVSFMGIPEETGTWTVMELEGGDIDDQGLVFAGTVDTAPLKWTFAVDNSGPNGLLTVSFGIDPVVAGPEIIWDGGVDNEWITTNNWLEDDEVTLTTYADTAQVIFDAFRVNDGTVNLTTSLSPFSITVDTDVSAPYTFTGTGSITGATGITKTGTGSLALDNTGGNDFTGIVDLLDGSITLGDATAFGDSSGNVLMAAGTTLDLGGFSVTKGSVTLAGGTLSNGTLTGDVAVTDTATINVVLAGASTLAKSGAGALSLSAHTYDGATTLSGGTVQLGSATALGSVVGTTDLISGTLDLNGQTIGETITTTTDDVVIINSSGTAAAITAEMVDVGNVFIDGTGDITLAAVRRSANSGTRNIHKSGAGTLTLAGAIGNNRYGLRVNEGDVILAHPAGGAIRNFPLQINNSASTVTAMFDGQYHNSLYMEPNTGILDLNGFALECGGLQMTPASVELGGTITSNGVTPATLTLGAGSASADRTWPGTITDGTGVVNLIKGNSLKQTLTGTLAYTGSTTINDGTLELGATSDLDDGSVVLINGATSILKIADGVTDVVDQLWIDGVQMAAGTYGSSASTATNTDDVHFAVAGTGVLSVTSSPVVTTPFADWATLNGLDGSPGFENGPNDDPDGDGDNLYEYFFWNSDPTVANVFGSELTSSGSGPLTFTHDRPLDLTDVTVTYQWTADLSAGWTDDGASDGTYTVVFAEGTTGPAANGSVIHESVEVTPSVTVGTPTQVFVRVTVTQP